MNTTGMLGSQEVLSQLKRIIESVDFDASDRNKRFLSYIVELTLAGEGDRIKAFTIATAVFGRGDDFDPQIDPIVRIEASRLRRALERYYLTAGTRDPIRITVPKGSYVPLFESIETMAPAQVAPQPPAPPEPPAETSRPPRPMHPNWRRWAGGTVAIGALLLIAAFSASPPFRTPSKPVPPERMQPSGLTVYVMPFADENYDSRHPHVARAFTRGMIAELTNFKDLKVFADPVSLATGEERSAQWNKLGVDFVVTGGITTSVDKLRVVVSLLEAASGRHLWSRSFDSDLNADNLITIQDTIIRQVVHTLGQRYGVILSEAAKRIHGRPGSLSSYECVLGFYHDYWRQATHERFVTARDCLERTVALEPTYAEAMSSLALLYLDAFRNEMFGVSSTDKPLERALDLATLATRLEPQAPYGHRALYLTYWLKNDVTSSLRTGETALALAPEDTDMMADLGMRYCLAGQWDRGYPLVQTAFQRNPGLPDQYRYPLFLRLYQDAKYEDALKEALKINLPGVAHPHMARAMAHAKLGHVEDARKAVAEILRVDPRYGERIVHDLSKRNIDSALIDMIVEGLSEAGLKITAVRQSSSKRTLP